MKQIQDIRSKTQPGSAPTPEAAAAPDRRRRFFGGKLLTKAGVFALLLGLPLGASLARAGEEPQYQFVAISLPPQSEALGINDEGLVTGAYVDPVTVDWFSFLFDRGALTTGIEAPGATDTFLGPANDLDVESGNYGDETNQQAVLHNLRRGTYTPLPEIPDMPLNFDNGINDAGHAVGVAYPGGTVDAPEGLGLNWFWDGRHYSFFTVPGSEVNGASVGGLNDWDQISGYYLDDVTGLPHGFIKDGSHYTTLDVPGAFYTIGGAINNEGDVAGLYVNPDTSHHGFLWSKGKFVTVDATVSGSIGTEWIGLNNHGDLAGIYFDATHATHAVIALRVDGDKHWDGHR